MDELIGHLSETVLFNGLTSEQIRKVLTISRKVMFHKNEVIMEEGQIGDAMYIILEGAVQVIKTLTLKGVDEDSDGKNKIFTRLDARQHPVFGEISLLEESERTATVMTVTDCVFYEIKKNDFLRLAESDYELGYRVLINLARIVSSRLRKVNEDAIKLTTVLSLVLREK
jgi:CRP/FNR family cyclic AMP-dependent transcriptional regulator